MLKQNAPTSALEFNKSPGDPSSLLSGFLPAVSQHEARTSRHLLVGESSKKALQKTSTLMILKENGQSELGECQSCLPRVCSASANLVLTDDSLTLEPRMEPWESLRAALRVLVEKPASPSKETGRQQLFKNSAKGSSVNFLVPLQRAPFKVRGQVLFDDIVPGVVDAGIAAEAPSPATIPPGPLQNQTITSLEPPHQENRPKHKI